MNRVTDEQILEFAASNECTEVVITRPLQSSGNRMSPVIYLKFTCACGRPGSKKWKDFKKSPICCQCMKDLNPRVTDEMIKDKLNTNGCEFVSSRRVRVNKTRIMVKFICECDKETTRIVRETQWDVLASGGKCVDCGNRKRGETNIKTYNENSEAIREKIKKTSLEKYGVEHPMHCAEIMERSLKNSYLRKTYRFPNGREVLCQGYEPLALNILLRHGIDEIDIFTDKEIGSYGAFPKFMYEFGGSTRRYYPDIYVASDDKFIEVKSDYTLGLERDVVFLKAQTVKKYGYDIEIWVFNGRKTLIEVIKF